MFTPGDPKMPNSLKVSNLYRPIVPNNEEALQVFENDEQTYLFFIGLEELEEDSYVRSQKDVTC